MDQPGRAGLERRAITMLAMLTSSLRRSTIALLLGAMLVAAAALPHDAGAAEMELLPAQDATTLFGPHGAKGAIVWSHGRSLEAEDSLAPTPDYVLAFQSAGWDTYRFNRLRVADGLTSSGDALAREADALKQQGYRRVVLAGQSFGAFVSLIAADETTAIDAVIATAPAAYGSRTDNPYGYQLNASGLYYLLGGVRSARVALFFFANDIFDPGGRGPVSNAILAERGLPHLVVDQPLPLSTHWATADPAFTARFAPCLTAFASEDAASGALDCRTLLPDLQIAGLRSRTE
jgi:dienelactone hydrolase